MTRAAAGFDAPGARAAGAGFGVDAGCGVAAICPDMLGRAGAALDTGGDALRASGLIVVAVCAPGADTAFSRVWETAGMAGTVGLPSGFTAAIEPLLTWPLCQTWRPIRRTFFFGSAET